MEAGATSGDQRCSVVGEPNWSWADGHHQPRGPQIYAPRDLVSVAATQRARIALPCVVFINKSRCLRRLVRGAVLLGGVCAASSGSAAGLQAVHPHGSYTSLGVIITLSDPSGNEHVAVSVSDGTTSRAAHAPTRFDERNWATSMLDLLPGTEYQLQITLTDPDGVSGASTQVVNVTTQATLTAPTPARTWFVAESGADSPGRGSQGEPYASLQYAVDQAAPGDEIRVVAGSYAAFEITDFRGSEARPLVIRADDPTRMPVIQGTGAPSGAAVNIAGSEHIWLSGLEITQGGDDADGKGVRIHSSAHVVVEDCEIHDNGYYNVLVTKGAQFPGGVSAGGFHVIRGNHIYDSDSGTCAGASNQPCPGQTYYGVQFENNPGAGSVVTGNRIHGHVDNVILCGNEAEGRALPALSGDVLALTGGPNNRGFTNHDAELAHNELYDARDDDLELDGICVNAKVYGNLLRDAENPLSMAPALPGPYFVLRNIIRGAWGQAAIKMNTNGDPQSLIRNLYFYHNTIFREDNGTVLNLWYDYPGEHSVPLENVRFLNNVMVASVGGRLIDSMNRAAVHPTFDYDLWYTTDTDAVFTWWNGASNQRYAGLQSFSQGTGNEANGLFAPPQLEADLTPMVSSPALDSALVIPGINDRFVGSGPDRGAIERGVPGGAPAGGAGGGGAGGVALGGAGGAAGDGVGAAGGTGNPGGKAGSGGGGTPDDDAGCGCRVPGDGSPRQPAPRPWLAFSALIGVAWLRRRVGVLYKTAWKGG